VRFLLYSTNFSPELTGIGKYMGELEEWLAEQGHDVLVVTAPPYYPEWKIREGYSPWKYVREESARTIVVRCPLWVPDRLGFLHRLLHLFSFAFSTLPVMLASSSWRPDIVFVVEPTILSTPAALICARLSGAKAWLHIQDFELQAAFRLGFFRSPRLLHLGDTVERFVMRRFDQVSTISESMVDRASRIVTAPFLFPNWVDTHQIYPCHDRNGLRAELGLNDKTVALYSGSMGRKQGIEMLVDVARELQDVNDLHFVLGGEGASKAELQERADGMKNITFLPLQPMERLNELLNLADIHLLPQRAEAADLVMPSKLIGMLASGRPVIVTALSGTELARVVEKAGLVVPPADAPAFARAVRQLAADPILRERMGNNAAQLAASTFGKRDVLGRFEARARELVKGAAQPGQLPIITVDAGAAQGTVAPEERRCMADSRGNRR
jgi:colanic acid biosynthesis glycosyl transferase WcaI